MKTTFYELTEATRIAWGIDPYEGDLRDFIVNNEGSIANNEGDVLEFKILKKTKRGSLEDYLIEIDDKVLSKFPKIKELL